MKNWKKQLVIITLLFAIGFMFLWCTRDNVEKNVQTNSQNGIITSVGNVQTTVKNMESVVRVPIKWNQVRTGIHSFLMAFFGFLLVVGLYAAYNEQTESFLRPLYFLILDYIQNQDGKKPKTFCHN